uniref:10 kDa chaperonin 1, chloroplastic n=1 Tax=Vitis vinifera TaxID=29760 RepID=F6GVE3_VITVI
MASTFITLARPFSSHKPHTPSPSKRLLGLRSSALKINAIAKKWEPTKVVPQADRVLIRLQDLPEKSSGGVLLPKSAVKFERYLMGEILSIGADVGEVEAGKKVLFSDINAYEMVDTAFAKKVTCWLWLSRARAYGKSFTRGQLCICALILAT